MPLAHDGIRISGLCDPYADISFDRVMESRGVLKEWSIAEVDGGERATLALAAQV